MAGEQGEPAAPLFVVHDIGTRRKPILRILVPVQLLPDAARCRQFRQLCDQDAGIGIGEIGMGDVGMRPAGGIRDRLHPARLVKILPGGPVGLDIDRFDDVAAGDVAAIFVDRIVAADRLIRPEDARHLRTRQPRQITQPPDMMMGIDGGHGFHRGGCFKPSPRDRVTFSRRFPRRCGWSRSRPGRRNTSPPAAIRPAPAPWCSHLPARPWHGPEIRWACCWQR